MSALVIGSGVAGIATVGWLERYDAPYEWVDAHATLGGMLRTVHNPIIDFPGIRGEDGREVADELARWAADGLPSPRAGLVEKIERHERGGFDITIDGKVVHHHVVVIATGTRRRTLGVPGEAEGLGDYVLLSTSRDPQKFAGHRVAIVGGADAAVEGSLNLADAGASEVIIIARSRLKAQQQFVAQMRANERIRRYDGEVEVTSLEPHGGGCRVHLDDGEHLDVHGVFVRIGVEPVLPKLTFEVDQTPAGFLVVDGHCHTSVKGLYAVGDIIDTPLRSVATCVGDGARAGRSVAETLGIWT